MTEQFSKSAARFSDFHSRTGSSSTKGFQNGRVDVLPPGAKDNDLNALPVIEQYKIALRNYEALKKRYQSLLKSRGRKGALIEEVKEQLKSTKARYLHAKQRLHMARMESEGALFREVCRARLRQDLYLEICREMESLKEFSRHTEIFDGALGGGQL